MDVDFAVELGEDDDTLDFPWAVADGGPRYFDLRSHPEFLSEIAEARTLESLRDFLRAINSRPSILETAKCDAWSTTDINPQDEIFDLPIKFGSYVDLLFSEHEPRFSFSKHEQLAQHLTQLLKRAPEMPASAEFLIRRCYYHSETDITEGFYFTFYLFGFGDELAQAQMRWEVGVRLVQNAILQLSR
ncbi:MAG: hypothetical protein M3O09_11455 [Acidobacteriota bacterium]|nr:hypothetical protein [Acidobacteriota bacterium]